MVSGYVTECELMCVCVGGGGGGGGGVRVPQLWCTMHSHICSCYYSNTLCLCVCGDFQSLTCNDLEDKRCQKEGAVPDTRHEESHRSKDQ